jgi:dipeptidyl aminopeptidase/acylaminoacyl peptidase
MTKSFKRAALAAATALACAPAFCAPAANADPASIPVEAFFDYALMSHPHLSPAGDSLAFEMRANGSRVLAVVDTATLKNIVVVAKFADGDVCNAHWVNNTRLVFSECFENGVSRRLAWDGLFAVDRDGGRSRMLIRADVDQNAQTGSNIKLRMLTADHVLERTLDDGSPDIIVTQAVFAPVSEIGSANRHHSEVLHTVPKRLDTISGSTRPVVEGLVPEHAQEWFIDGQGHVQAVLTLQDGKTAILVPNGDGWKEVARFDAYAPSKESFDLREVASDGRLYVTRAGDSPEGTHNLYRFDTALGRPQSEPLVSIKGFDFDGELVEDVCKHKVLGIHYGADAKGSSWLDSAMAKGQAKIDTQLPGRVNRIEVPSCGDGSTWLVTSMSDRSPPQFLLYSPADDHLRVFSNSRPEIDPRLMAITDFYRIKARDGREFPVYVTKPRGKGPFPAVVLVHGGPMLRGWSWEWEAESQFLASRGYLVVRPEYRGSAGYGEALLTSGFRQWGQTMQDDIADATVWASKQGLADPQRTCIAGGSYGGYAALMGLARYPELYRCGIASSAVADIGMMYDTWWSDGSDDWKSYGMPVTVGDPVKDAAQFAATSPLKLAAHITHPLLLAHGGLDERVPIEQANALHSALEANHAPVTWLYYPEDGHGLYIQKDRADYYRHVEAFLATNIGSGAAATVAGQAASSAAH